MEFFWIGVLSFAISGFFCSFFPPNISNTIYLLKHKKKIGWLIPIWCAFCFIMALVSFFVGVTYYGWMD